MKKSVILFGLLILCSLQLYARRMPTRRFNTTEMVMQEKLFGTLVTPFKGENYPLVIIVAGSGPTDRNGNSNMGLNTDCYKKLADSLAMNGIASFRFDKRGVADSKDSLMKEDDLLFETYITDTKNWIAQLKKLGKPFGKFILAGHSEGSLIAMCAMVDADAYISIAGIANSADATLKTQLKGKLGDLESTVFMQLDSLKNGKFVTCTSPMLMSLLRPSVQPYMKSWFAYTPTKILATIKKPCLLLQGTKDIQVQTINAQLLKKANPKAKLVLLKSMNHVLVNITSDDENSTSYQSPQFPLHAKFVNEIVLFCKKLK